MASILFTGTAVRYPGIRWIFSHGGGTVPFLLSRFTTLEANMKDKSKLPNGVVHELRRFYYDTAQANHAGALAALLKLVPVSQVVLGTDYPFRRALDEIAGVTSYGFSAADVRAIERDNALRILRHA
jgi:predicted TIM-barrel fold metal-dependent hydrolase